MRPMSFDSRLRRIGIHSRDLQLFGLGAHGPACMIRNQILSALACVFTLAILLTAVPSHAAIITLTNQNSTVHINDTSSAGQTDWLVDGTNQLAQRWFWVSVNGAAPVAVNTLAPPTVVTQSANSVTLSYSNPLLATVTLSFTLQGQALGTYGSDLAVQAGVTNLTGAQANVSLLEYADFDLNPLGSDVVSFRNANDIQQTAAVAKEETAISAFQAYQGGTPAIVLGAVTTNSLINFPAIGGSFGPADASWAVRWNRILMAGGGFTVSESENIQNGAEGGNAFTLGDFTLDGFSDGFAADPADLPALMNALSDLSKYKSQYPISGSETNLRRLGNFKMLPLNNLEPITNADVQELIDYLANSGAGSLSPIPEPNSLVLLCLGGAWLAVVAGRTHARNRSNRKHPIFAAK
jgi:hypothetical protein